MSQEQRVLIVDDEEDARESLKRVIERAGFCCTAVESAEEGLRVMKDWPPHIVVSDHDMPGMNGVEFLSAVGTRSPNAVRILLTGRADFETSMGAINSAHVYRYLNKPCRSSELLMVLHFAWESVEMEQENRRLRALARQQQALLNELQRRVPDVMAQVLNTVQAS